MTCVTLPLPPKQTHKTMDSVSELKPRTRKMTVPRPASTDQSSLYGIPLDRGQYSAQILNGDVIRKTESQRTNPNPNPNPNSNQTRHVPRAQYTTRLSSPLEGKQKHNRESTRSFFGSEEDSAIKCTHVRRDAVSSTAKR